MFNFTKKKPQQPDAWAQFTTHLDNAISDAIAARIDLVSIADKLESRAASLNVQHAINAPHASALGPRVRVEEKLSARQIEALRREALGE